MRRSDDAQPARAGEAEEVSNAPQTASYDGWVDDPAMFHTMYLGTVDTVLAYFRRRVFDPEIVLDLTADVYATAWRKRRRYRFTGAPIEAWLVGIAKRVRLRHIDSEVTRRRTRERLNLEVPELDDASIERIECLVDSAELRRCLDAALDACSDDERQLIAMRFDTELPYAVIARHFGVTEGAARVRLHRTLQRLNLALADS